MTFENVLSQLDRASQLINNRSPLVTRFMSAMKQQLIDTLSFDDKLASEIALRISLNCGTIIVDVIEPHQIDVIADSIIVMYCAMYTSFTSSGLCYDTLPHDVASILTFGE